MTTKSNLMLQEGAAQTEEVKSRREQVPRQPSTHTKGIYRTAVTRLLWSKTAIFFGSLVLLIVIACAAAPVYAKYVAHATPNETHITDTVRVGGKIKSVVPVDGAPIGPTWHGRYFLGADRQGRDLAVRLLYGGRNSLQVAALAAGLTVFFAVLMGLAAGYFRGIVDGALARVLDLIWAYPAVLLGIALGTSLALGGINLGFTTINSSSLFVPALVIGVIYIPYLAKPIRAQVLGLREREYIDAARLYGAGSLKIIWKEILPNISSTIVVFIPLIIVNAILLEAGLSYLGAGVRPPNPSWGSMIGDGITLLPGALHMTLVPGIMLVLCVLGVNIFGDCVRDALDSKAKIGG